jgi:hypothetical protein
LLLTASAALAQGTPFTLATYGCPKSHCTTYEDDANAIVSPPPASMALHQQAAVFNDQGNVSNVSNACSGNGTIVACKSLTAPYLNVYNRLGQPKYNSCGSNSSSNCGTNKDLLDGGTGVGLVSGGGEVIVAGDHTVVRFDSAGGYGGFINGTPVTGSQSTGRVTCLESGTNAVYPCNGTNYQWPTGQGPKRPSQVVLGKPVGTLLAGPDASNNTYVVTALCARSRSGPEQCYGRDRV